MHGTVLSWHSLQNFLRHFLHEERCTNVSYMNNFCSTLHFIFVHKISQHCELYLYISQEKLSVLIKQFYRYGNKHRASKRRLGRKQRAGAEEVSSRPVFAHIGFPVLNVRHQSCSSFCDQPTVQRMYAIVYLSHKHVCSVYFLFSRKKLKICKYCLLFLFKIKMTWWSPFCFFITQHSSTTAM
jgi:hypothetical protein